MIHTDGIQTIANAPARPVVRKLVPTNRTAIIHGESVPIYETCVTGGMFDGARYEVTPDEMTAAERELVA